MEKTAYMTLTFKGAEEVSLVTTVGDAIEILQEQVRNLENGNGCEELSMKPILLTEEQFRKIEEVQKSLEEEENELYISCYPGIV